MRGFSVGEWNSPWTHRSPLLESGFWELEVASSMFCQSGRRRYSVDHRTSLIVGAGSRACAIPIGHVAETMRPLPIEPIEGMPPFLLGLAVIRGTPVPVVSLSNLIGASHTETISRFVALRLGSRRVALA